MPESFLISILVIHIVRLQDEEESTTMIILTTTTEADEQVLPPVQSSFVNENSPNLERLGNQTQSLSSVESNASSRQRIIIALSVLCVALLVLLGFFVSIVIYQWLHKARQSENRFAFNPKKTKPIPMGPSPNYRDHAFPQAVKL